MNKDSGATLAAAKISAWVSGIGAVIAAAALLLNTYWGQQLTEKSEKAKREIQVLLHASGAPTSQIALLQRPALERSWHDPAGLG
jgi:hypothetical protein